VADRPRNDTETRRSWRHGPGQAGVLLLLLSCV
jgi:hypothetical protein